jgi:hypothetical protein
VEGREERDHPEEEEDQRRRRDEKWRKPGNYMPYSFLYKNDK